jgi:hypothetical protein
VDAQLMQRDVEIEKQTGPLLMDSAPPALELWKFWKMQSRKVVVAVRTCRVL